MLHALKICRTRTSRLRGRRLNIDLDIDVPHAFQRAQSRAHLVANLPGDRRLGGGQNKLDDNMRLILDVDFLDQAKRDNVGAKNRDT